MAECIGCGSADLVELLDTRGKTYMGCRRCKPPAPNRERFQAPLKLERDGEHYKLTLGLTEHALSREDAKLLEMALTAFRRA